MMECGVVLAAVLSMVSAWGLYLIGAIWWAHNPTRDPVARIHINGWHRLRRWLTNGPLPTIRRISTRRLRGCGGGCDGCYVDTCSTLWCRGVWVVRRCEQVCSENNHKSTSRV